jgi:hypothetical protein
MRKVQVNPGLYKTKLLKKYFTESDSQRTAGIIFETKFDEVHPFGLRTQTKSI